MMVMSKMGITIVCSKCEKYICVVDSWQPMYEGKIYCEDCYKKYGGE